MTEVAHRYARIAEGFSTRLDALDADALDLPTPCSEWSVAELCDHVITTTWRVATMGGITDGDQADQRLPDRYRAASTAIIDALADPTIASTPVSSGFGEQPFESLIGRLLCADTLIHTWDLARAAGLDERLDVEAAEAALLALEPADEAIRRPGGFAPKLEAPEGADPQTLLLAFCGRSV